MTDDVLSFLEKNYGKRLRLVFTDGKSMECLFDGYSYDFDEEDKEFLELDFERLSDGLCICVTPAELQSVEVA